MILRSKSRLPSFYQEGAPRQPKSEMAANIGRIYQLEIAPDAPWQSCG
jgi:hypothetical protein